jgi:hypothetical protein
MTARHDPDVAIAAWLNDEAPDAAPERLLTASRDRIRSTHQRRAWWSLRMTRPRPRFTLAAALIVAMVTLGSAFFVIERGLPAFAGPGPSASASASASQPIVVGPSATPTPSAGASPTATVSRSLELTWTKVALDGPAPTVAWIGDRFVLVDEDSGTVFTSTDGFSWQAMDPDPGYVELLRGSFATWDDDVVGWWNPEDGPDYTNKPPVTARDVVQILRPPAAPAVTTPWEGRIQSMAIGPAGIVAQVHSHLDWDAWVASKLGDDWVSRYKEVSFKNGILEITMKRGRGLKVVWADEGFELGDFQDAGFGWYSPDGERWTQMPVPPWSPDRDSGLGFVTGFGDVVGVSDGFIARGTDGMWHSSDGLGWRNLGDVENGSDGVMLPWMGGALVTDGVGRFDFWTSRGQSELPMAADVRAASKQPNEPYDNAIGTGTFGAAIVSVDNHEILVTRDGIDWDIQPMPAEMAAAGAGRPATTVAVGERSVLVLLWAAGSQGDAVPSLWLGTVEP